MKINLGSGYRKDVSFINIDKDSNTNPDYVIDIENDKLPFEDNTVEEVRARHIFEYIGNGYLSLIKEIYRVCKNEAIIDIQAIHYRSDIWYSDPSHVRFITVDNLRVFSKKYIELNKEKFKNNVNINLDVDFELIDFSQKPSPEWDERFKTLSIEQIIEISRNFNNIYDETYIKMMVIK
jgi:ubiquinone/menaquinone biosynthesis C-methylase UbiE